jgi:secondary thiamine-phosphate synthase enzyme
MSKRSAVTSREAPLPTDPSLASDRLLVHSDTLSIDTHERVELIDLTDRVMAHVRTIPVREGVVSMWSMHTTTALLINESQQALLADIKQFLEDLVGRDRYYHHNDPSQSDCSRANADAHLRAMLLGHSLTLQISGGEVVLGQWQRILLAELDGPRQRSIRLQIMGIGRD